MSNHYKKVKLFIQESIVAKSTLKILASALVIAVIASVISIISLQRYQQAQIEKSIEQLASTVESSASIAAFTSDEQLANEVTRGLLTNQIVKKVVITVTVNKASRLLTSLPVNVNLIDSQPFTKQLYSPFNADEQVGKLEIWLAESLVKKQASAYAKFTTLILLAILICITSILSWVIYQSITKPIKSISDEIHSIKLHGDSLISTPPNNKHDEIGRLVLDTNQLISRLKSLISSEHKLRVKHESDEQRLRMIFDKSQTGMFVMNDSLTISSWNPALLSMLNFQRNDIKPDNDIITLEDLIPAHITVFKKSIQDTLNTKEPLIFIINIENLNKKQKWLEVSMFAIDDKKVQGIFNDITSHKIATLQAIKIAERDPLTGLLNRRGFEPKLEMLMQHQVTLPSIALLVIDLDSFKQVNDEFGHDAGDFVLKEVSQLLIDCVRKDDLIARLGGDEFAIILNSIELPERACRIAKKVVNAVSKPIIFNNQTLQIGASVGIAVASPQSDTPLLLIKHADEAMYMAKQAGKSRYHLYNS